MRRRLPFIVAATGAIAGLLLAACGSSSDGSSPPDTVTVFAASSLTDAFTDIGAAFEDANPGVTVEFNFGASSDLAGSITGGDALGVADVFASADPSNMDELTVAGANAGEPEVFARNQAQIAVPAGNPGDVEGLEDLADEELFIGLCAEDVPCGAYAREILANAGVDASVDTDEAKVTDVVAKVAAGELDAGIVYVTDVRANADEVDGIEIPADVNVDAAYPITTVAESGRPERADAFVAFVLSGEGQAVLAEHGFLRPA